ncbi:MAG: VOC family protein [Bacteroidota bacterium]|nr:VOC family protein [Bacteroidota bacterium]
MANSTFSHIGLVAKDPIRLEEFYTQYFGFRRTRVYAPGPDQVVMIKKDAMYFEIFKATEERPDNAPIEAGPMYPCWRHVCFAVENLDEMLKELENVAKITLGPADMSAFIPGMRVAWLADPEGNIIEVSEGYKDEY